MELAFCLNHKTSVRRVGESIVPYAKTTQPRNKIGKVLGEERVEKYKINHL